MGILRYDGLVVGCVLVYVLCIIRCIAQAGHSQDIQSRTHLGHSNDATNHHDHHFYHYSMMAMAQGTGRNIAAWKELCHSLEIELSRTQITTQTPKNTITGRAPSLVFPRASMHAAYWDSAVGPVGFTCLFLYRNKYASPPP